MSKSGYPNRLTKGRKRRGHLIGIAYDGEVTEESYFRGWQQILAQGTVQVFPEYVNSGGNPKIAVREAIKLKRRNGDISEMWCVTDVDGASAADVAAAKADAVSNGLNLCLSDRCFEVWIALHFARSAKPIMTEADAVALVAQHQPEFTASNKLVPFSVLLPKTDDAVASTNWLTNQGTTNPATDVDKVVLRLAKFYAKQR
jgi:hypothetical protein